MGRGPGEGENVAFWGLKKKECLERRRLSRTGNEPGGKERGQILEALKSCKDLDLYPKNNKKHSGGFKVWGDSFL